MYTHPPIYVHWLPSLEICALVNMAKLVMLVLYVDCGNIRNVDNFGYFWYCIYQIVLRDHAPLAPLGKLIMVNLLWQKFNRTIYSDLVGVPATIIFHSDVIHRENHVRHRNGCTRGSWSFLVVRSQLTRAIKQLCNPILSPCTTPRAPHGTSSSW